MKLFLTGDTGGSGHGSTALGFVKYLLKKDACFNFSTHQWGWNTKGFRIGSSSRSFLDTRFKEKLFRNDWVNPDYLLSSKREFRTRPHNLQELPFGMNDEKGSKLSESLMIKRFSGQENVNLAIGSINFAQRQPREVYSITETTVNTTMVPDQWDAEGADEIWVPCEWSRDAVARSGHDVSNVEVMPYGVEFWSPTFNAAVPRLNTDKFVFGAVGRWCNLKGLDVLIQAYVEEFVPSKDDVLLFIKTTTNNQLPLNPDIVTSNIKKIIRDLRIPDPPEIGFGVEPLPVQQYWDMLGTFDCYVHPSRAEAIGISLVQAMSLGLPCIAVEWSAVQDYFDKKVGFPLDFDVEPVQQQSEYFYFYDEYVGEWANPDVGHLRKLMREVYEMSKDDRNKIGSKARERVKHRFSWDRWGEKRMRRLAEVVQ